MITRRQSLFALGAAALFADDTPPRFTNLDHIEFFAASVEKSTGFYARVFGNAVAKNNRTTRRYLKLGASYIAIENAGAAGVVVDHVCAGVPGFDVQKTHAWLTGQGVAYRDYPSGKDLSVADPDGTRLQLAADKGWTTIPASPEAIQAGAPIFDPLGIDHVLLNVADQDKAAAFFTKVLGPVASRGNGRVWFQVGTSRLGILETPKGEKAGVNHFCVLVRAFDAKEAVKRLAALGAKIETPEAEGSPEFRDSDGYLGQVKKEG